MSNIVFIAPPGAGKGTQSDLLVQKYNMEHISTGDMMRDEIKRGTELGKNIESIMNSGKLVDDEIVTKLLRNKLKGINNGFILDGYPRKSEQCVLLDNLLHELNLSIDHVFYFNMDYETAKKRILGRITCPKCNRGYNKFEDIMKPKRDGICDICSTPLESRNDDNEESFKIRFLEFISEVQPIIEYYEDKNLLRRIDCSGTPTDTFKNIEEKL